jgi:hypothetical protein
MANGNNTQILEQMTFIQAALQSWIEADGGKAIVAFSLGHMWTHMMQKDTAAQAVVAYEGEDIVGDEATAENVGVVMRNFIVGLKRNRGYSDTPGDKLTATAGVGDPTKALPAARPFYSMLEEARDVIRSMEPPYHLCLSRPVIYKGVKPFETPDHWTDAYTIEFSMLTQLPYLKPGFGNIVP